VVPLSAAITQAADDAARMNVLFIISDDLRTELGCYASPLAKTPNLDRLATTGVRFERAYCQYPLCNPSRSSMLTGRYPTTTGVIGNRTWFGERHPEFISLPKYFQEHGYVTLRAGKIFHGGIDDAVAWTVGGQPRRLSEEPSNDVQRVRREPPARRDGLTKAQYNDRWVVLEGDDEQTGDHRTADRAIRLLKEHRDEPFFLGVGFSKPHSPLAAPKRFFDMFDVADIELPPDFATSPTVPDGFPVGAIRPRNADLFIGRDATPDEARQMIRGYLASTAWMDWNVGRVLDALDELGLRENTIVVFWGDHGFQLGEKGKWSKAGSLWEQGARVPLFVCDPRNDTAGQASPRVVESIDIYPTLCELCGLPPAAGVEGRSLQPLLEDPDASWNHPAYTVWSEDGRQVTGVAVRTEHWRYAEFFGRGAGTMLIDSESDPHEMTNIVDEPGHSEVTERLSRLARRHVRGRFGPRQRGGRWPGIANRPDTFMNSDEAVRIADNLLVYQHANGGWDKNLDMARPLTDDQKARIQENGRDAQTIIDNGATYTQIRYLARVHTATGQQRFADATRRGIDYLLEAQYDNGGWPMIYPLRRGYYTHITFNDGAMIGVMRLLRDVASGEAPFEFVGSIERERVAEAVAQGLDAILKCQVVVDGQLTAWCAQHDEENFQPRGARTYELPSLSGQESVGIVEYLMEIDDPSPEVVAAIEAAVEWFREVQINGWRVETNRDEALPRGRDRIVVDDPDAPPLWARFYEIGTNRPMFVGRDGVVKETLAEIEHERRVSYSYLGEYASKLLDEKYPAWKSRTTAE
jgi:PelA/Pel-15E family pectate lyase